MTGLQVWWHQQVPARGPFRVMAAGVFVTTAGEGAWYTSWAIYFTTVAGIRVPLVGVGLVVAGAVGLVAATPVGSLADRLGPRNVLVTLTALNGLSMAAFTLVRSFPLFVVVAVLNTAADRASSGVKTTYVAGLAPADVRLGDLACQRVASHVGYTLGAAIGAVCLSIDTPAAFTGLIVLNAATSLGYAALITRLPIVPAVERGLKQRDRALRHDHAFLAVTVSTGTLSLCWGLVSTGLPLWILRDTNLPLALAAGVVIINSLGIALLQVPASKGCTDARASARRAVWSGAALTVACLLLATTRHGHGALAAILVLTAAGAHLAGELWFIAAKWGLTLDLTPGGRTGQYQGAAATSEAAAQMLSPVLMTVLIGTWGQPGWLVLAGIFTLAGTTTIPTSRWAIRTRPWREITASR